MKKLNFMNPLTFYSLLIIVCVVITLILIALQPYKIEPGNGALQLAKIDERILVEIMSRNYLENTEFLLRAEIDGEQVGIVYFDENGEIQFDGDKEKFEDALYTVFKMREEKWRRKNE